MAFLSTNIIGNGLAQTAITNDTTLEAVINSLVANNTTAGALDFSVLIDDVVVFTDSVDANGTFRIPDKVNLGANGVLKIDAPTGVNIGVSYLQQAIDVAGALSAVQQVAQDATDNGAIQVGLAEDQVALAEDQVLAAVSAADRAEAALGTTASPEVTGGISIDGAITEQVSVCDLSLEPDNGTVQTYEATADTTFTDGLADGQFLTLVLTSGGFTMTFPTLTWWNAEPTLGTTDKIVFEKIGSTLYATQVGTIV